MVTEVPPVMQRIVPAGVLRRFTILLALWLVLIEFNITNLLVGAITAAIATKISLHLRPHVIGPISYVALLRLTGHAIWQSLVAGFDVARRALNPRLPLNIGYIRYPTALQTPPSRNSFRVLTSLQPGTLPVSPEEAGHIDFHCLDKRQPIAAELGATERLFLQVTCDTTSKVEPHD